MNASRSFSADAAPSESAAQTTEAASQRRRKEAIG
jgi:hypothetical protein